MKTLICVAALLGLALSASAETIVSFDSASGAAHAGIAFGQSVTTPDGGPWDNIQFNFINGSIGPNLGHAYASGGLYVLTQAYAGTLDDLSSATAGYLSFTDTIDDGVWKFSDVTLNPDTQYYFYMSSAASIIQWASSTDYAGGNVYGAGGAPNVFISVPADTLFDLSGTQVSAAPEPGTLALMAGAAGLLAAFRRREA